MEYFSALFFYKIIFLFILINNLILTKNRYIYSYKSNILIIFII
ncbi:hypothetical protein RU99_GL000220 [Enterococcus casseliflavus]|nr:hypothetical protein RU99_GL000220 [Enterococcus casseliflavus]